MFRPSLLVSLALIGSPAFAGDVLVSLTGDIISNSYSSGPFANGVVGTTATISCEVNLPGMDIVPGQLTNFSIDLSTFQLDIGGPTGAMLAGTPSVQIQNDFPAADGFRFTANQLASGHFFSCGFGTGGGFFSTTDISQLIGTYDAAANLTSFGYSIMGMGGSLEIFPDTLTISLPSPGTTFCDPMDVNSTGFPTTLTPSLSVAAGSGIHFEATSGPPNQFGFLLVGDVVSDPGVALGQGRLCLNFQSPNVVGRYNFSGTPRNSTGMFDAAGVLQNLVSTSSIGTGFDVPLELPLVGNPTIAAGSTWHFQLWHRESGASSNLSNGVSLTF